MSNLIQWPTAKYWTAQWNPIIGCKPCSPACENCYAAAWARRFGQSFEPHESSKMRPPRKGVVFCGNMTDLFGGWVDRPYLYFGAAHEAQYKQKARATATYLWLTKRVDNLCRSMGELLADDPLWQRHYFGFTAENQDCYDRRFKTWRGRAPLGFNGWLSAEPLLGPIDLHLGYIAPEDLPFKWVAVGCESGPKRRPCKLEWIEGIVQQCLARDIPVFVKQIDIDGRCERNLLKFPHHLPIRQVPWED